MEIMESIKIRTDVSANAISYAKKYYDGEKIRKDFKNALINIYQQNLK